MTLGFLTASGRRSFKNLANRSVSDSVNAESPQHARGILNAVVNAYQIEGSLAKYHFAAAKSKAISNLHNKSIPTIHETAKLGNKHVDMIRLRFSNVSDRSISSRTSANCPFAVRICMRQLRLVGSFSCRIIYPVNTEYRTIRSGVNQRAQGLSLYQDLEVSEWQ